MINHNSDQFKDLLKLKELYSTVHGMVIYKLFIISLNNNQVVT